MSEASPAETNSNGGAGIQIKDLAGLSKPLEKGLGIIQSAVGAVFRPLMIRATGNAQADALKVLLPRLRQAGLSPEIAELSLSERTELRITLTETKRQENIEAICHATAEQLSSDEQTSAADVEPIDVDWIFQFIGRAQDVSNEHMQSVWSKVLSGEIRRPGSFSIRAMHTLSLMTIREAEAFRKLCTVAFHDGRDAGYILLRHDTYDVNNLVPWEDFLLLCSIGLLYEEFWPATYEVDIVDGVGSLVIGGQNIIVRHPEAKKFDIGTKLRMTPVGRELMKLVDGAPDDEYIKALKAFLMHNGCDVELAIKL